MDREKIEYSDKFLDDEYEYRQVILPREYGKIVKEKGLLTESEWRKLGVAQSRGWEHYGTHPPEPHILLFRRKLGTNPLTGKLDTKLVDAQRREATLSVKQYLNK